MKRLLFASIAAALFSTLALAQVPTPVTLQASQNLADLASASTARTNLGLGSLAVLSTINNSNWSGAQLTVANGGTNCTAAALACFNNITGFTVGGTTGTTSTNLVFSTSPSLTTPTLSSPTLSGTVAGANTIPLSILAQAATKCALGNGTAGLANITCAWTVANTTDTVLPLVHGAIVSGDTICANDTAGTLKDCGGVALLAANNLSDLGSASTARTNLGLGSLATLSSVNNSNWSGTQLAVANGGTNCAAAALACFNNITGLSAGGTTGTTSTNLVFSTSPSLTTPTMSSPTFSGTVAGANTVPLSILAQAATKCALGNGTAGLANVTCAWTVANTTDTILPLMHGTITAGDDICANDTAGTLKDCGGVPLLKANNLSDLVTPATARTNLGLGSLATLSSVNNSNWSGTQLAVANGGTNCAAAALACFNNITGFTAGGTTGTTSTNLVFSTSPSLTTPSMSSPTLSGTVAGANTIPLSILAQAATKCALGNGTSGTANITCAWTVSNTTDTVLPLFHGAVVSGDAICANDTAGTVKDCGLIPGTVASVTPGAGVASSNVGSTAAITASGTLYADASYFPMFLGGLTMSNDGTTPNTVIDSSLGAAVSDDATALMKIAAFTKTTGAWTLGTGNGCLDTGAVANSSWYSLFVIERTDTGVVDELCSLSATAPTMPTSYTKKRRIGSFATNGSGNIRTFIQDGSTFYWTASRSFMHDTGLGTTAALETLDVPTGVKLQPVCTYTVSNTGNSVLLSSPDEADELPTTATPSTAEPGFDQLDVTLTGGDQNSVCPRMHTNTSGQIRARASAASTTVAIITRGWVE